MRRASLKVFLLTKKTERMPCFASVSAAVRPMGPALTIATGCIGRSPSTSETAADANSEYPKYKDSGLPRPAGLILDQSIFKTSITNPAYFAS